MRREQLILGRWRVVRDLGGSLLARTMLAEVSSSPGQMVVVKQLQLTAAEDWKQVELFERGARALKQLDHPQIPRFHDVLFDDETACYYLVQEFVEGMDLGEKLRRDGPFNETALRTFLKSIFEILQYLHGFSPPVIHRDIKPSNIMVRPNGEYVLIDFDVVQTILDGRVGGTTVAGTIGYMPPEQLFGMAVPASDLYALGATAVHLATGVEPWRLPTVRNRVQFEHKVSVSEHLKGVLCAMLEPEVGARVQDVVQARARLDGRPLPAPIASQTGALTDIEDIYDMSRARAGNTGNIRVSMHGEQLHVEFYGTERFSVVYALLAWLGYFWAAPGDPLSDISSGFWLFALLGVPGMYLVARAIAGNLLGDNRRRQSLVVSPTRVELRRQSHLGLGHWRPARRVVWSIPRQQVKEIDWQDGFESAEHRAQALNARGRHRYRVNLHLTDEAGVQYPIQVDRGKLQKPDILAENNAVTQVLRVIQAYLRDY